MRQIQEYDGWRVKTYRAIDGQTHCSLSRGSHRIEFEVRHLPALKSEVREQLREWEPWESSALICPTFEG